MQFVDVVAIPLATLTLLRSCQALDLTPAACSFGTNEIIGDYFEYIVPPHKVMAPGTYVPMKRSISCSRYYDSNLGEWYRLLRELHDRTNHSPDIPMLVTLGLSGTKTAESLTDALRRCLPLVDAPIAHVTSHSCRKSGTAEALAIKAAPHDVLIHGCWKSADSMFPYTNLKALPSASSYHFFGHLLAPSY